MSSPIMPTPVEDQILDQQPGVAVAGVEEAEPQIAGRSLSQLAWARLRRDKTAMACLGFLALVTLAAIFAPVICKVLGVGPNVYDTKSISDATAGLPQRVDHRVRQGTRRVPAVLCRYEPAPPARGGTADRARHPGDAAVRLADLAADRVRVDPARRGPRPDLRNHSPATLGGWTDTVIGRSMDLLLAFPLLLMLIALTPVLTARLTAAIVHLTTTPRASCT